MHLTFLKAKHNWHIHNIFTIHYFQHQIDILKTSLEIINSEEKKSTLNVEVIS